MQLPISYFDFNPCLIQDPQRIFLKSYFFLFSKGNPKGPRVGEPNVAIALLCRILEIPEIWQI